MELIRNIFFNTDKVVENTDVRVTYAGKLFQNNSSEVWVHYGFGENWDNAQDIKMEKTELGYQVDIHVEQNTKLNFCFKNAEGEWDNNNGSNYAFKIERENWYEEQEKSECIENESVNNCENCEYSENSQIAENQSLIEYVSTWGELFKKTWNNFVNIIKKLFKKQADNVESDINE